MMPSEGKAKREWVDKVDKKAFDVSISKEGESYFIENIETRDYSAMFRR